MDGGTVWNVNVDSAVTQCLDMGYEEEDIIMDVIICGYSQESGAEVSKNAATNWLDARNERSFYRNTNSIQQALDAYPGVDRRFYIQGHDYGCDVPSSLDFNNSTTWCLQEAGREDAKEALDLGQENIQKGLDEWLADRELQKEHPTFTTYLSQLFSF